MSFRSNKQIKMVSGKMYLITGNIVLLPEKHFFPNETTNTIDFEQHFLDIDKNSKPAFFIFIKHIYDSKKILYAKVLYNNKIYITQNEYHIGNFIELLN